MATATKERKSAKVEGGICLLCGKKTKKPTSRFLPGNDAKMKSLLLKITRGEEKTDSLRPEAKEALRTRHGLLGFKLRKGKLSKAA